MSKPTLWEVMADAAGDQWPALRRRYRAAEIRALRDWLVPEEPEPRIYEHCDRDDLVAWHQWDQRQGLRALLTTEADRAERGNV